MKNQYPGIAPVQLIEGTQADGQTPGTDVGAPRHPAGTHQGSDIDMAYYGSDGNDDLRSVCGDGTEPPSGGGHKYDDGGFCTTNKNVVDWHKEALFLAQMAMSPYYRTVCVDRTMPTQLVSAVYSIPDANTSKLTYVCSSDPTHYNHAHVSYCHWGSPGCE
jgi:hypothetical protein